MATCTNRFASLSDADIEDLILKKDAKNTRYLIQKSVKLLNAYCAEKGIACWEERSNSELDDLLGKFYAEARRQNGDFYAKKSLQSTRYGLQRHFDKERNVDIVNGTDFKSSNVVYKSMLVRLKDVGKGKVNHKKVIHPDDLQKIMSSSALDQSTPRGLQNKVFLDYMLYFANRGRENLREMTKGDLKVQTDPSGAKYVELVVDKLTKTERGEGDGKGQGGVMYETPNNTASCPVSSFERYVEALHPDCSAFWQRPKLVAKGKVWYDRVPVGKNTLYSKTKDICAEAGISQKYTNHCLRATCVTALDDAGYEARDIMTVSGHKSEASICSYSRTSDQKKRKMSEALSSLMPPSLPSSSSQRENHPPSAKVGQPVLVENLVVDQQVYDPVTNTMTLPPIVVNPEGSPEPELEPSFVLDFDDSALLLTSSQEEMALKDITNSPFFGQDIQLALGLQQSATSTTSVQKTNMFNFYNCNVQIHQ